MAHERTGSARKTTVLDSERSNRGPAQESVDVHRVRSGSLTDSATVAPASIRHRMVNERLIRGGTLSIRTISGVLICSLTFMRCDIVSLNGGAARGGSDRPRELFQRTRVDHQQLGFWRGKRFWRFHDHPALRCLDPLRRRPADADLIRVSSGPVRPARADREIAGRDFQRGADRKGRDSARQVVELFASSSGSWTMVVTTPNGTSCLVAAGENWDTVRTARGQII
jgi:hypothetical protein